MNYRETLGTILVPDSEATKKVCGRLLTEYVRGRTWLIGQNDGLGSPIGKAAIRIDEYEGEGWFSAYAVIEDLDEAHWPEGKTNLLLDGPHGVQFRVAVTTDGEPVFERKDVSAQLSSSILLDLRVADFF